MIHKLILIILMILLLLSNAFGTEELRIDMPELNNPGTIDVQNGLICIGDGTAVMVYSSKDFTLIRRIGRQGEGPGEFTVAPGFSVSPQISGDRILINSIGKISFFTSNGTLEKELKTGSQWSFRYHPPYFIGYSYSQKGKESKIALNLYSEKFELVRQIHEWNHAIQDSKKEIDLTPLYTEFCYKNNRLYYAADAEMQLSWFDTENKSEGKYSFKKERVHVDRRYKDKVIDFFKNDKRFSRHFSMIKKMFRFRKRFPAIKSFHVERELIYVQTYNTMKEKNLFIIIDGEGNIIRESWVPFRDTMGINILPDFSVSEGRIYQLVEDEDNNWYLTVNSI